LEAVAVTSIVKTGHVIVVLLFKHLLDVGVLGQVMEEETEGVGGHPVSTGKVKTCPTFPVLLFKHLLDVGVLRQVFKEETKGVDG